MLHKMKIEERKTNEKKIFLYDITNPWSIISIAIAALSKYFKIDVIASFVAFRRSKKCGREILSQIIININIDFNCDKYRNKTNDHC